MLRTAANKPVLPALWLVAGAFLILGAVYIWVTWRDAKAVMISLQREQAENAAAKIHEDLAMVEKELSSIRQTGGIGRRADIPTLYIYFPQLAVQRRSTEQTRISH